MANEPMIPAGMKPWHGGDAAPADWDGGSAMSRNGMIWLPSEASDYWQDDGSEWDYIAYTPRTPTESESGAADERVRVQTAAIIEIAKTAHAIGWQAGVGGMETAGAIVSYLAQHQDQIAPFFRGEVSPIDWPDFTDGGCLTWHAAKGDRIVHPSEVRAAFERTAS